MKTKPLIVVSLLAFCACNDSDPIADWKRVNLPTDQTLYAVAFANDNVGFIGAAQKATLTESRYAFNSMEYAKEIHINSDSTKHHYVEVHALNPGPVLFKTADGGNSWREVVTPFISDVVDIFLLDQMIAYVMTRDEGLYQTIDGGATWKRVLSNVAFFGDGRIVYNVFQKVHFFTPMEGIAYNHFKGAVVKTVDGGENWSLVPFFDHTLNVNVRHMVFTGSTGTGFAVYQGKLITTADYGNTWRQIEFTAPPEAMSGETHTFSDLVFVNENRGFTILAGKPHMTIDGGQTWNAVTEQRLAADKILVKGQDEIYMQFEGNPAFSYFDISTEEYRSFTTQGDPGAILDWSLTGNSAFAVGYNAMLLKYQTR